MPCLIWNLEHSKSFAIPARWHMMVYRGISFLPMVVKRVVKSKISSILLLDIFKSYSGFPVFSNFTIVLL